MDPRRRMVMSMATLLVIAVLAGLAEGLREAQGFMYLEKAKMSSFNKLENIAAWKPRPDDPYNKRLSHDKTWTMEKKKEALKVLPEMLSYIKHNTMTSEQVGEHIKKVMDEAPKFPKTKKEKEMEPKANPFESAFARQFVQGTKRVAPDTKRQVKGNYRGGLIRIMELEWAYGARDVSQSTEELLYVNHPYKRSLGRRSLASSYLGVLEDEHLCVVKEVDRASVHLLSGATNTTAERDRDFCDHAQAFNVIIDLPLNMHEPMESVTIYLPGAVVDEYSLILPEDQSQTTYEKVCFDYPLMLYNYATRELGTLSNVAHSCNERFCSKYWCLCGKTLFNEDNDRWNIIPAFCPLSSFYPDFLVEP